jgi:hypothetical protein
MTFLSLRLRIGAVRIARAVPPRSRTASAIWGCSQNSAQLGTVRIVLCRRGMFGSAPVLPGDICGAENEGSTVRSLKFAQLN